MIYYGEYIMNVTENEVNIKYYIKPPSDCTTKEINDFVKLIKLSGEVSLTNVKERVKRAYLLGFAYDKNKLVSITSLKNPNNSYKTKIFTKANILNKIKQYKYELGWSYTLNTYRRKGINFNLKKILFDTIKDKVYATTRTNNKPSIALLKRMGFNSIGKEYKGKGKYNIQIFGLNK